MINIDKIIKEFKAKIEFLYKDKFKEIILYGSWARGEATKDSDIDLVVVLKGEVNPVKELNKMIDIITNLNLKYNILLSIYPISEDNYANINSPLLINVRKEGLSA